MTKATFKNEILDPKSKGQAWRAAFWLLLCFFSVFASRTYAATTDEKLVSKFVGKSCVLQSVHAFSPNPMGTALLIMMGFVCGLFDGITLFWSAAEVGKKGDLESVYHGLIVSSNLTVGDVVKGIDEFYGDAANAKLPAICAYLYFAHKSRGDSNDSLEKRLTLWRKMFNR